jgi:PIN domain nuclease of toxin-antitoxin system
MDTAAWINGVTMPKVLPPRIRGLLEQEDRKGLCSVSLLEAAILHRLGRLEIDAALTDFFAVGLSSDVHLIDLTPAIAAGTNDLPKGFHGDPFDRVIVATAAA